MAAIRCSATTTALKLADYVVTEAGFGADLGAEKFIDIKCRKSGLRPAAVVIVATVRALKYHGGADLRHINDENLAALENGIANLQRHVGNVRNHYGLPCVVSVNHFTRRHRRRARPSRRGKWPALDVPLALARHWAEGGAGAADVRRKVVELVDAGKSNFRFVYDDEQTLWDKIKTVATKIYGAADITADSRSGPGSSSYRSTTATIRFASPKPSIHSRPIPPPAARPADTWSISAKCASPPEPNSSWPYAVTS